MVTCLLHSAFCPAYKPTKGESAYRRDAYSSASSPRLCRLFCCCAVTEAPPALVLATSAPWTHGPLVPPTSPASPAPTALPVPVAPPMPSTVCPTPRSAVPAVTSWARASRSHIAAASLAMACRRVMPARSHTVCCAQQVSSNEHWLHHDRVISDFPRCHGILMPLAAAVLLILMSVGIGQLSSRQRQVSYFCWTWTQAVGVAAAAAC